MMGGGGNRGNGKAKGVDSLLISRKAGVENVRARISLCALESAFVAGVWLTSLVYTTTLLERG